MYISDGMISFLKGFANQVRSQELKGSSLFILKAPVQWFSDNSAEQRGTLRLCSVFVKVSVMPSL